MELLACGRWYKNGALDITICLSVQSILGSIFDNYESLKQDLELL